MAPTLLGLLDLRYVSEFFGRDVLHDADVPASLFMANYQTVGWHRRRRAGTRPKRATKVIALDGGQQGEARERDALEEGIAFYQAAAGAFRPAAPNPSRQHAERLTLESRLLHPRSRHVDCHQQPAAAALGHPFGLPPFDRISSRALRAGLRGRARRAPAEPTPSRRNPKRPASRTPSLRSTAAGGSYWRIEGVFHNLAASDTSPALQQAERELAPQLAAHQNAIYMHRGLFERIAALHARRDELGLTPEQRRLLSASISTSCAGALLTDQGSSATRG